jgi:hypothetical protein
MDGKCARCLAGLCDHQGCGAASKVEAVTDVAGTRCCAQCCAQCAPVLLELVLHPLTTVVVNPPVVTDGLTRRQLISDSQSKSPLSPRG